MHGGEVVGETECSRCGARAKMRAVGASPAAEPLALVITCTKCMLRRAVGFTTRRAMKLAERRRILERAYETAGTPDQRGRIIAALSRISEEEKAHELGL